VVHWKTRPAASFPVTTAVIALKRRFSMSQPLIFVSSTYIDLRDVRSTLDEFISQIGFKATMFEKGGIPFDYDIDTDKACYDEVKRSDLYILIIGGRYGSPASEEMKRISRKMKKYNSITKKEYETALESNLPMHIFVDQSVSAEYRTWKNNKGKKLTYAHVDNENIFDLIHDIYNSEISKFVKEFSTSKDISDWLREQWAGLFKKFLMNRKNKLGDKRQPKTRINSYKLFYYRHSKKKSMVEIAKACNISVSKYRTYESPLKKYKHGERIFPLANEIDIEMIAMELGIHKSELMLGNLDDFSFQYYDYYTRYKGKKISSVNNTQMCVFPVKVLVFDFDGTLTNRKDNLTTWEKVWVKLGYSVNDCGKYHSQFSKKKIDHKEWCDITLRHFKNRSLSFEMMKEIANDISLIKDTTDVLSFIEKKGITLHLLSGSIDIVINEVLGEHARCFSTIKANAMRFSQSGIVDEIIGTKYDFHGKADYLKRLISDYDVHPHEVLYIGNSGNDRFAHLSGARTLCINPHFTDPDDDKEWTQNRRQVDSLKEILPYVFTFHEDYKEML
jgi:phosphoserine phosphatase